MKYLIVIPARGGSKGIPLKNIYPVAGKPLITYTLDVLNQIQFDGDIVVSTDSKQIKEIVKATSDIELIERPDDISGDTASTEAALIHALREMEKRKNCHYDAVVTLQATSPLRKAKTIEECMHQFEKDQEKYDALLTLTETREDYWIKKRGKEYCRLAPQAPRRRQEREPLYIENSAIYITKRNSLLETNSVLGYHVNGYVIPEKEGVDINGLLDILFVEAVLKQERDLSDESNSYRK